MSSKSFRCIAGVVGFALVGLAVQPALANGPAQSARALESFQPRLLPIGNYTLAPFAYMQFCVESPEDCGTAGSPMRIVWNGSTRAIIAHVNRDVNMRMRAVNDEVESWTAGGETGDCEDFALTKRRELLARGVPASAVRMATARTASGTGHAVLVVATTAGDFVLDNRSNRVQLWHDTKLDFLKIASAENPRVWQLVAQR